MLPIQKRLRHLAMAGLVASLTTGACDRSSTFPGQDISGHLNDDGYVNEPLGFQLPIPDGWHVAPPEARDRIMGMSQQAVTSDEPLTRTAMEESFQRTRALLMVSEHELGAPVVFNDNINVLAEYVGDLPGVKTGHDYLFHTRLTLEQTALQYENLGPIEQETIDGQSVYSMAGDLRLPSVLVKQRMFAFVRDGHAVAITTSAGDEGRRDELVEHVRRMRFTSDDPSAVSD